MRSALSEGLQQVGEQRNGNENDIADFFVRQLETADVGFIVVDLPDAANQAVIWFADTGMRSPLLLPIYAPDAIAEQLELAVTAQESLSDVKDKAYSEPPDE